MLVDIRQLNELTREGMAQDHKHRKETRDEDIGTGLRQFQERRLYF